MNKILSVLCILLLCISHSIGQTQPQQRTTTTPQKTTTPQQSQQRVISQPTKTVTPPPYVLKKDFETKMDEITPLINSAMNTSASLKREVSVKLNKVDTLDMKMRQVEEILSSANFKISTTSDSLKKTQFSMDEFRKRTDSSIEELKATDAQMNYIWVLLGLCVVSMVVIIVMMNNRMKKLKTELLSQSDSLKTRLWDEIDRQQKDMKSEINSLKVKMQNDISQLKAQVIEKINHDNEATSIQLKSIIAKLNEKAKS